MGAVRLGQLFFTVKKIDQAQQMLRLGLKGLAKPNFYKTER
jgi:hypothetical protein